MNNQLVTLNFCKKILKEIPFYTNIEIIHLFLLKSNNINGYILKHDD